MSISEAIVTTTMSTITKWHRTPSSHNAGNAFNCTKAIQPNTFNTGKATSGKPFRWGASAAMDFGANVLAVENYRSGMPWTYFMKHPVVQRGMERCGLIKTIHTPCKDNFDHNKTTNAWGGLLSMTHTDDSPPAVAYVKIRPYSQWVKGRALRMRANATGDTVRFSLENADLSKHDMLSFWLKGSTGNEQFSIGLQDTQGHETALHITNGLDHTAVSTDWSRVHIPLKKFAVSGNPNNDVRITSLAAIHFNFHAEADIIIDDLAFLSDDLPPPPPSDVSATCINGIPHIRWGRSTHDDVVGYHLWRNTSPTGHYTRVNKKLLSAMHTYRDTSPTLAEGIPYYYAVQCVDRKQNAGPFSSDLTPVSITLNP